MPDDIEQQICALQYALEQADGRSFDLEMMLRAEKARTRELEVKLTEERHMAAVLEHALAGASWALTEAGIDVTGGQT